MASTPKNPFPTTASTPSPASPANPTNAVFGRPAGDDDFVIDMSGIDLSSNIIGEGRHPAFISKLEKTTSKAGDPMLVWDVTMYGGDFAGKTIKMWTVLTPNAMWKVYENMEAVGFDLPDDKRFRLGDLKTQAVRSMVMANVVASTYNGRPSANLASIEPFDGQAPGTKVPAAGTPS